MNLCTFFLVGANLEINNSLVTFAEISPLCNVLINVHITAFYKLLMPKMHCASLQYCYWSSVGRSF